MDFLKGKTLLQAGAPVSADTALKKKILILYYFTMKTSESCRLFDLKLQDVYDQAMARKLELGIIIVGTDSDMESYNENMKSNYQQWYTVKYGDELMHILMYNYGVTHAPSLIVVRKNGDLVTREGVKDIEEIGLNVLVTWSE